MIDISAEEFGDPCPATPKYLEVHYGCVPRSSATTKRPLPAWFLQGGSDQLWQSRIPDPPEGFEREEGSPAPAVESTSVETRIPITTPTGTSTQSTTQTTTTQTTTVRTTTTTMSSSSSTIQAATQQKLQDQQHQDKVEVLEESGVPAGGRARHCAPTSARGLDWSWTQAGDTAVQPCPPATTGLARWSCGLDSAWTDSQPDMGDCRSLGVTGLERRLQAGDPENVVSAALAHQTRHTQLYGGDVEAAAGVMRSLASQLQFLLQVGFYSVPL